jgi:aspartate aminotransferase
MSTAVGHDPASSITVYEDPFSIELSPMLANIEESSTLKLNAKKLEMEAKGIEVFGFTAGELSFPMEEHVVEAMIAALKLSTHPDPKKRKLLQYTPVGGTPQCKKAIQAKFKNENGLDYETSEIIATAGAKEALAEAVRALAQNEKVLIPSPAWVSYHAMVKLAGGEPVTVETNPETFKLTPELLKAALEKEPETKCLILNSPCNPSGAVYSRPELEALAKVLKEYPKVVVISDDIYEHIRYDKTKPYATMAQIPGMKDRTVTINGASKVFAMTGQRIGYAAAPAKVIKGMEKIQGHSSGNPNVLAQVGLVAALDPAKQEFVNDWMDDLKANRDMMVKKLKDMGFKCNAPDGAFYAFPDCSPFFGKKDPETNKPLSSASAVADYLLKNRVLVVPGDDFGDKNRIRLSFAAGYDYLDKGLDCMAKALAKLSGPTLEQKSDAKAEFKGTSTEVGTALPLPKDVNKHGMHGVAGPKNDFN